MDCLLVVNDCVRRALTVRGGAARGVRASAFALALIADFADVVAHAAVTN